MHPELFNSSLSEGRCEARGGYGKLHPSAMWNVVVTDLTQIDGVCRGKSRTKNVDWDVTVFSSHCHTYCTKRLGTHVRHGRSITRKERCSAHLFTQLQPMVACRHLTQWHHHCEDNEERHVFVTSQEHSLIQNSCNSDGDANNK